MYLLDTCALLWLAGGDHDRLSSRVKEAIDRHSGALSVSAISALEIGIKAGQGKILLSTDPATWFERAVAKHGLHEIAMTGSIAAEATLLPPLHKDPCDRVIIATSRRYDLAILTPDELISRYPGVRTLW